MSNTGDPNTLQQILLPLLPSLLGGGMVLATIKYLANWRRNNRSFDLKMDEFIKQNRQLNDSLISYVDRKSLDKEIDNFLNNSYIACAILGPAGSGKTRYALNIAHRNKLFSKYRYVYINDRNGLFFASEDFKNNYLINGKRRYVFIFDYYYENVFGINNLLDKANLSGRHKFIFIERDYGWETTRILDRPEYLILMEKHNMTRLMLASVFCNQVFLLNRKLATKHLRQIAIEYATGIKEKIDPEFSRPIFAQLIASMYVQNCNFTLDNIDDKSQLVSKYWYYKLDEKKITPLVSNIDTSEFIAQLDALLRILILISSISKKNILIEKRDFLYFQIEGDNPNSDQLNAVIKSILLESFIDKLESMNVKEIKQLFGIVLKDFVKSSRGSAISSFKIASELDLVTEWVLFDVLRKSRPDWLPKILLFLSSFYRDNYVTFIKRSVMDFRDLVELLADPSLGNAKYKNFVDLISQLVDEAYLSENSSKYCDIIEELMAKAYVFFKPDECIKISTEFLLKIKECYLSSFDQEIDKKQISEILINLVATN